MAQLKSTSITGDLSVSGKITGTFSGLTASRALVTNSSGNVAVSAVTSTELGYLDGVTSAIQTQLNGKAASSHGNHVGSVYFSSGFDSAFRTQTKGDSSNGQYLSTIRTDSSGLSAHQYGAGLAFGEGDTHGYIDISYSSAGVYVGGGNANKLNWIKALSFTDHTHNYAAASHGNHVPTTQTASNKVFLRNDNTWQTITPANIGAAASSHGNHVPTTQTASNKVFLRNDNTWQTVTPSNIGLKYTNILANGSSSSSISWSSGAYDFIVGISRPNASNTPCQFVIPVGFTGDVQIADDATYSVFTVSATSMTYNKGNNAKIICAWGVNVV